MIKIINFLNPDFLYIINQIKLYNNNHYNNNSFNKL